jgi:SAM-dependent methyltransferase
VNDEPRGWASEETARRYHEHTAGFGSYARLGERLVELAGIAPGMDVIDLACGTGVVTAEVVRRLEGRGSVLAVDASAAMLAVAERVVQGAGVRWVAGRAEDLDRVAGEPVDRVLCSSALWQMSVPETLAAVRAVLRPDGRFVFNLPDGFFPGLFPPAPPLTEPLLTQRMVAVAILDYGYVPPTRPLRRPFTDLDSLVALVSRAGLALELRYVLEVEVSPEAMRDWLRIPVFTDRILPGYDYATRMAILDRACEGYAPAAPSVTRWGTFVCRVAGPGPA